MNYKAITVCFSLVFAGAVVFISSCDGEKQTPPTLTFISGSAFVSTDTAIEQGAVFNVGIYASKTGTEGLLHSCKISRSINGGADSTIHDISLTTQYFSQYYSYVAGDSGNTERYTFTVTKNDGLSNTVSVTVTDK